MSVYLVIGRRAYRGHEPHTTFEASLNPAAEQRAVERGAIRCIKRTTPSIQPGSYQLPDGWPMKHQEGSDV